MKGHVNVGGGDFEVVYADDHDVVVKRYPGKSKLLFEVQNGDAGLWLDYSR